MSVHIYNVLVQSIDKELCHTTLKIAADKTDKSIKKQRNNL